MARLETSFLGLGARPALLIVDASRAFTDPTSPLGADFDAEIDIIVALMALAREHRWPRYLSTVWYENDAEAAIFRKKVPALNGLLAGLPGVALDERLPVEPADRVFRKTHASCFFGTRLNEALRGDAIDSVVIGGFTTSGCIRASAVDALQHDYRTTVVSNAVGDRDHGAHEANLHDLQAKYADVCALDDLQRRAAMEGAV